MRNKFCGFLTWAVKLLQKNAYYWILQYSEIVVFLLLVKVYPTFSQLIYDDIENIILRFFFRLKYQLNCNIVFFTLIKSICSFFFYIWMFMLTSIISVLKSERAALNAFMEGEFAAAFASIIKAWAWMLKTFPNSDKILPTSRSASWLAYSPTTFLRHETEGASGCVATNTTRAGLFERPQSPI